MSLWEKIAPSLWHHVSKPFAIVNDILIDLRTNRPVLDYNDLTESPPFNVAPVTPTGAILLFAGSIAPDGYLLLGSDIYVSRTTFASLFAVIGITFGSTTSENFKLPDTAGVLPRGVGTSVGYTEPSTIALGEKIDDSFQSHYHGDEPIDYNYNCAALSAANTKKIGSTNGGTLGFVINKFPTTDGTAGTPRTGKLTQDKTIGLNYIIKT